MGISKRELMEDYYIDEIDEVIAQWNALRRGDEVEEEVDPLTFFGYGGEVIGDVSGGGKATRHEEDWGVVKYAGK